MAQGFEKQEIALLAPILRNRGEPIMTSLKSGAVESLQCESCNKDYLSCVCPREQRLARLLDALPISEEAIQVYRNQGSLDFYRLVACQMFGVTYSQTTSEQCRAAREFYLAQVRRLAS